jgi:hypothetical protein
MRGYEMRGYERGPAGVAAGFLKTALWHTVWSSAPGPALKAAIARAELSRLLRRGLTDHLAAADGLDHPSAHGGPALIRAARITLRRVILERFPRGVERNRVAAVASSATGREVVPPRVERPTRR